MRTVGDYRQLNDALFHAGLKSGSQFEWIDKPNRLQFYVVDLEKDGRGILTYTIGVRRSTALAHKPAASRSRRTPAASCSFNLTNTGAAASDATYSNDIYRLSATAQGAGWTADLADALAAVTAGETATVPIHMTHSAGSASTARVTLKAQSESDPAKSATATCTARR